MRTFHKSNSKVHPAIWLPSTFMRIRTPNQSHLKRIIHRFSKMTTQKGRFQTVLVLFYFFCRTNNTCIDLNSNDFARLIKTFKLNEFKVCFQGSYYFEGKHLWINIYDWGKMYWAPFQTLEPWLHSPSTLFNEPYTIKWQSNIF